MVMLQGLVLGHSHICTGAGAHVPSHFAAPMSCDGKHAKCALQMPLRLFYVLVA